MQIVLATSSPYRHKAFTYLGIPFIWQESKVNESFIDRPKNPKKLVLALAQLKAEVIARKQPNSIVIGFDSVGYYNQQILEKPKSKHEAFYRLKTLSGHKHFFYTGVFMIDTKNKKSFNALSETEVYWRKLTNREINQYLDQDDTYKNYAVGYDPVSHLSSTFCRKINGSYNNMFWGIPLELIPDMLQKIGYKL